MQRDDDDEKVKTLPNLEVYKERKSLTFSNKSDKEEEIINLKYDFLINFSIQILYIQWVTEPPSGSPLKSNSRSINLPWKRNKMFKSKHAKGQVSQ